jgi:tRNA-Thr(GGU) m(6)t(6)A37 methyltransferase TsaA
MHKRDVNAQSRNLPIAPIGTIHTPFKQAAGTPIQGVAGNGAEGDVELLAEYTAGLQDLAGFERVWLIYFLDRASEVQMVVHPYMDAIGRGVFATRSPARPNHIGISVVRLLGIENNRLSVADVEMLDGTPLLDIKPYVPAFDSFVASRAGWYGDKSAANFVADGRFEAGREETE